MVDPGCWAVYLPLFCKHCKTVTDGAEGNARGGDGWMP